MRKVALSILVLLLASINLFAAPFWSWTEDFADASATTKVSLNTSDETLQAEIGFTTKAVGSTENGHKKIDDYNPVSSETGVVLNAFDSTTGKAWNNSEYIEASSEIVKPESETKLYATWLLQSGKKLNIYLYADGQLKLSSDELKTIGWKVTGNGGAPVYIDCTGSANIGISPSGKPDSFSGKYIEQHNPNVSTGDTGASDNFKNYGSVELVIQTDSIWALPAGEYTANLNMVIEVVD